jgi:hypothetical protein
MIGITRLFETSVWDNRKAAFVPFGRLCTEGEVAQLRRYREVRAVAVEVVEDKRAARLAELDRLAESIESAMMTAVARVRLRKAVAAQRARVLGAT